MRPERSAGHLPLPGRPSPSGFFPLVTTLITVFTMGLGGLLIQPRLVERRDAVGDEIVLTASEVKALPEHMLAVVLDRSAGLDQQDFRYQLLQLVMERSGQSYVLGLSEQTTSQDDAIAALEHGGVKHGRNPLAISVGVYGANAELNRRLQPVPIPITGGLLCLRAGWTHRDEQNTLSSIQNLEDLREITLLQGLGWSDVEIFDASRLRTFTARSDELLRLVENRRVQLFPRGIAELEHEAPMVSSTTTSTVLDDHLLIAYPFAGFFYVSRSNPLLAEAIRVGFERAIEDGSYQRLVDRMIFTPWLRDQLKLENRSVVVVLNPAAATALMDVDPRHWMVPWGDLLDGDISMGRDLCETHSLHGLCTR